MTSTATLHEHQHDETHHTLTRIDTHEIPLDELDETLALARDAGQLLVAFQHDRPLAFTSTVGVIRFQPVTSADIVRLGGYYGTGTPNTPTPSADEAICWLEPDLSTAHAILDRHMRRIALTHPDDDPDVHPADLVARLALAETLLYTACMLEEPDSALARRLYPQLSERIRAASNPEQRIDISADALARALAINNTVIRTC